MSLGYYRDYDMYLKLENIHLIRSYINMWKLMCLALSKVQLIVQVQLQVIKDVEYCFQIGTLMLQKPTRLSNSVERRTF
jgi:hypothetical protein